MTEIPWDLVSEAALSEAYAKDFTHGLYRYPARMSPEIARTVILSLTRPGATVLDPFSGGGTTAVEAVAHGRHAICADLNPLACFVTLAKASPTNGEARRAYGEWVARSLIWMGSTVDVAHVPVLTKSGKRFAPKTHGFLLRLRNSARQLKPPAAKRLALLTVLSLGQRCFDCRTRSPHPANLPGLLERISVEIISKTESFELAYRAHSPAFAMSPPIRVLQGDSTRLARALGDRLKGVSLVLTSPPYPGVHVLYHRWQLYGRGETDLPYTLLGLADGSGESAYTMGSRMEMESRTYFVTLHETFRTLREALPTDALVAQVVAFSDPARQRDKFRRAMTSAGYAEVSNPLSPQEVISRMIPHRRWYANLAPRQSAAREFVFFHKPARTPVRVSPSRSDRGTMPVAFGQSMGGAT